MYANRIRGFIGLENWSNNSCFGYVIKALERSGYKHEEIERIVRAVRTEFEWMTVGEAKEHYERGPY